MTKKITNHKAVVTANKLNYKKFRVTVTIKGVTTFLDVVAKNINEAVNGARKYFLERAEGASFKVRSRNKKIAKALWCSINI